MYAIHYSFYSISDAIVDAIVAGSTFINPIKTLTEFSERCVHMYTVFISIN